ncbi:MAG TPA: hypothetical protein VN947_04170 [Polyangia bacterium]|nr:hypothetical protein [Polyangia bacterium]
MTILLLLGASFTAQAQGPVFALQAADAHGHHFDLSSLRGNVVAVTFVSRYTQDEGARVNGALGTRGDVKVVSVVDFTGIPGFVHGYARRKVAEADGRVQHLCDETSTLGRRVGAHPRQHVDIFIVDRDGGLRGRFEGQQQLGSALRLLDEVRTSSAQR